MSNIKSHIGSLILDRIKASYGFKTDLELSNHLGVAQNTISTWRRRDTCNLELIISKCDDINLNWLFRGEKSHNENISEEVPHKYSHEHSDEQQFEIEREITKLVEEVQQGPWQPETKLTLIRSILQISQEDPNVNQEQDHKPEED